MYNFGQSSSQQVTAPPAGEPRWPPRPMPYGEYYGNKMQGGHITACQLARVDYNSWVNSGRKAACTKTERMDGFYGKLYSTVERYLEKHPSPMSTVQQLETETLAFMELTDDMHSTLAYHVAEGLLVRNHYRKALKVYLIAAQLGFEYDQNVDIVDMCLQDIALCIPKMIETNQISVGQVKYEVLDLMEHCRAAVHVGVDHEHVKHHIKCEAKCYRSMARICKYIHFRDGFAHAVTTGCRLANFCRWDGNLDYDFRVNVLQEFTEWARFLAHGGLP